MFRLKISVINQKILRYFKQKLTQVSSINQFSSFVFIEYIEQFVSNIIFNRILIPIINIYEALRHLLG
jgi:hypothetical protein